ncbi:hypothetical protein HZA99_04085 [Candidatus Woesearchaeota archaeon]|nr:hypothetical protein [Candidatus Woesearchaeota archaeon]
MEAIVFMQKEEDTILSQKAEMSLEQKAERKEKIIPNKETKTVQKQTKNISDHKPEHNSLQHDPTISVPLLSALVEALKKETSDDEETLETIAKEAKTEETTESTDKKKKKDSIVELAEKIKTLYANELEQMYNKALQGNYNANSMHYQNDTTVQMQKGVKAAYSQESYDSTEKQKVKAIDDENSTGYKISKGSKYQAFIMTDPKGRWHSTWEVTRILNETYDGKIERNDGIHYQGL